MSKSQSVASQETNSLKDAMNTFKEYQLLRQRRTRETLVRRQAMIDSQPGKYIIEKVAELFSQDLKCQDNLLTQIKLSENWRVIQFSNNYAYAFKINKDWARITMPHELYMRESEKHNNFQFEYVFDGETIKSHCQSIENCITHEPVSSEIKNGKLAGCYVCLECYHIPNDGEIIYTTFNGVPEKKPALIRPIFDFYIIVPYF